MKTKAYHPSSAADLHRLWLGAVDKDGPFLSVPALQRVWSQGMPALPESARVMLSDAKPKFEKAWAIWDADRIEGGASGATRAPAAAGSVTWNAATESAAPAPVTDGLADFRAARDEWVRRMLTEMFGWGDLYASDLAAAGQLDLTTGISSPRGNVRVVPSGGLVRQGVVGALVLIVDPVDSLRDPAGDGWATSPVDRMEELLRKSGVPIGVVTDGRWWALVSARDQVMVASGITDAQTWVQERATTAAFIELLQPIRLVGGRPEDRLPEIFGESVAAAEEITEALGVQVRRAVELLVQAISESAVDGRRRTGVDPLPARRADVYDAAVTVMMRVVFLLFAQERGLLPGEALFTAGYGISGELDALDQRAREEGAEALDGTHLTWHRLLATSQALFRGAPFEDLRLPAYHGSLFDPDRFPFLTALTDGGRLTVQVTDRVMLEVLRSVQVAALRGQPARRISFRDIDVEQIGYIYEGLLGYSCEQVNEVTVGLLGASGAEPEMPLMTLEELANAHSTPDRFADDIRTAALKVQPDSKPASKAALTKALKLDVLDAERALRTVTPDPDLRERLRPFVGVIRRDLRDRPFVVLPGGLVVVETPSRASAGAHYTPKKLATEVVEHALEPLVFSPGPHQTPDSSRWVPLSSEALLNLRVADIACGSGAFLVAAARYLAARLVEAWVRDDTPGSTHDLEVKALRQVVANCLYGADINPLAVEMCKLSLWLVSLDQQLSFSFVDDKVLHGNALLGVTSAEQLKRLRIDPENASGQPSLVNLSVDDVLRNAAELRRSIASEVDDADPQRSHAAKERQMKRYDDTIAVLTTAADGVIAAGLKLGGKPGKALDYAYSELELALGTAYPDLLAARVLFSDGEVQADRTALDAILESGLTPTVRTDHWRWKPLHWLLRVPDVMARGGFDAIVGNPPFLGGTKITGAMGTVMRDWLVNILAGEQRGRADLVAYFLLRASLLLHPAGNLGIIATNTVAQGDSREVGLDNIVRSGFTITRAVKSRSWPVASANLEYAAVWGTRGVISKEIIRVCDDAPASSISTMLEPERRTSGPPIQLIENRGITFEGCKPIGMGFVIESVQVVDWTLGRPINHDVLRLFLNGDDVNSRSDSSPSRWVIDFNALTLEEAAQFAAPLQHVWKTVRPERQLVNRKALRERWWQFADKRPGLRKATAGLTEMLVLARVSRTVMPLRVSTNLIPSDSLTVFATESYADQAILSASPHQLWAITHGSGMRNDPRYTPSAIFEPYCRPKVNGSLNAIGKALDSERREIMLRRQLGLTKLYNLINDPDITDELDPDIKRMRQIHVELDQIVMDAYGWSDVPLDHGFHEYRQMRRWTVSPAARVEILDRLLEENHNRAAAQGDAARSRRRSDEEFGDDE